MLRQYTITAPDALAIAHAFDIPIGDIGIRLGVTSDYVRRLASNARQAHRVRRAVLELALERERLQQAVRLRPTANTTPARWLSGGV